MKFKVSVIIPVYNAEKYLRQAVESVIHLPQTGEVVLVEDHSPDNSLSICRQLEAEYSTVRLVTHDHKTNLGAGAARNLGITNSRFNYVAFLDADDHYMPNRFEKEEEIFSNAETVDGVYGYTKGIFENEYVKEKYLSRHTADDTFAEEVPPDELLNALLFGGKGRFHTNAITLRKDAFKKAGYFDPELKLTQDTECWVRLAAKCTLVAGNIATPIAVRIVHDNNRIHNNDDALNKYAKKAYSKLFFWAVLRQNFAFSKTNSFFLAYSFFVNKQANSPLRVLLQLAKLKPQLFITIFFYRKIYQIISGVFKH